MAVSKKTVRFGPFGNVVANAVQAGRIIYISGQVSVDGEGNFVGVNDLPAQVKQAYENISEILGRLDASLDNVVDETWFVTDMEQVMSEFRQVYAAREQAYGTMPETTQTLVQVGALAMPELLVEIKCIAHL